MNSPIGLAALRRSGAAKKLFLFLAALALTIPATGQQWQPWAMKPDTASAVEYVASTCGNVTGSAKATEGSLPCSDSNDGKSWGTAKATLSGALSVLSSGGLVQFGAGKFTFTSGVTISIPVEIDCEPPNTAGNGTQLIFSPSASGSAITFTNGASGSVIKRCGLYQGNATAAVNGIDLQGVQGVRITGVNSNAGSSGENTFTGYPLLLEDSSTASAYYNSFENSVFGGGTVSCFLNQHNTGKTVNANVFEDVACLNGSTHSIQLAGNTSDNIFIGGDATGSAPTLVQVCDATSTTCTQNQFKALTLETTSPPANEIGFDNYGILTQISTKGVMTGTTPTLVKDEAGSCHILHDPSGTTGGPFWESTCNPLQFTNSASGVGINVTPQGNGLSFASGAGIWAGATQVAILNPTFDLEFPAAAPPAFLGSTSGRTFLQGAAVGSSGTDFLPAAGGTLALTSQLPFSGSVAGSTTLLAANSCGDAVTATITGATTSMVATASPQAAISAGLVLSTPFVSAANTVTVGYCNVTTTAITPAAATFNIRVIQ